MSIVCRKGCKLGPKGCGHKLHSRYTHPITHKRDREPLNTDNLKEAKRLELVFLAKLQAEAFELKQFPELARLKAKPTVPTFQEFAAVPDEREDFKGGKWWTLYANGQYAARENTRKFYRSRVKALLRYEAFAQARLDQIDRLMIDEFVAVWREDHKPYTVNQDVDVLKFVLSKALDWDLISRLPKFPEGRERLEIEKIGRMISFEDELTYLTAIQRAGYRDLSDLVQLCIDESIEPGKVILNRLDWSHISLDDQGPNYQFGMIFDPFTKRPTRKRNLPITTPRVHQMLLERWEWMGRPATGLVFEHPERPGQPVAYDTLRHQHKNAWELGWIDIPYFRLYDCRHTFLSRLKEFGGDPYDVQAFAGWSRVNPKVEGDYLHANWLRLGRAAAIYREVMEKAHLNGHLETDKVPLRGLVRAQSGPSWASFGPKTALPVATTDNQKKDSPKGEIGPKGYI